MSEKNRIVLRELKSAVLAGGNAVKRVYERDDFKVFTKGGVLVDGEKAKKEISTKYKTEADDASHLAIVKIMGERSHSGIPLMFEEGDWRQVVEGSYISFDELDGTGRFIKRKPGFMVLSQFVDEGKPVASANFDPVGGILFHSLSGEGSFMGEKRIILPSDMDIKSARVIVNGRDKERPENSKYWEFMSAAFGERLDAGLATGSRMAAILTGRYDAVVNFGSEELHIWDLGMALNLLEAGGAISRKDGSPIDFQRPGVIGDLVCCSNPKLHEQIIALLSSFKG